jgi:hypothetical protein
MIDNIQPAALLLTANYLTAEETAVNEAMALNKAAIFHALIAAGISRITVDYDGGGDEGNLEQPVAFDAESNEVEFPGTKVTIITLGFNDISRRKPMSFGTRSSPSPALLSRGHMVAGRTAKALAVRSTSMSLLKQLPSNIARGSSTMT